MTKPPLTTRVVEAGAAADVAGWLLGGLGAQVVQVRDSSAPPRRTSEFFDRGKRKLAMQPGAASSPEVASRLLTWASIAVLSTLDGRSLVTDLLREEARRQGKPVVLIRGTSDDALRDRPMTDITAWASSGILFACGYPHRPPTLPGANQAYLVGGLNAAIAALAAEIGEVDHRPKEIEIRLQECILAFAPERGVPTFLDSGNLQPRDGVSRTRPGLGIFDASDGLVCLVVTANRQWDGLARWMKSLGAPLLLEPGDFAGNPRARNELLDTINTWLTDTLRRYPVAHLVGTGQSYGVAITPLHTLQQFAEHPLFAMRDAIGYDSHGRKILKSPWRRAGLADALGDPTSHQDELHQVLD